MQTSVGYGRGIVFVAINCTSNSLCDALLSFFEAFNSLSFVSLFCMFSARFRVASVTGLTSILILYLALFNVSIFDIGCDFISVICCSMRFTLFAALIQQ